MIPKTRGDCVNGIRPCPYKKCKHFINTVTGETCTLDYADRGGMNAREVAEELGISRQMVELIEKRAIEKLQKIFKLREVTEVKRYLTVVR